MQKGPSIISLEPQDIFLFQKYIKKDLRLLFQTQDVLLWPANCAPDLLTTLINKDRVKETLSGTAPVADPDTNSVFLPLVWQGRPLGIAIFKDTAGTFNKDILSSQWPGLSQLILEKTQVYKAYFTDAESGALSPELFKDTLIQLITTDLKGRDTKAISEPESFPYLPGAHTNFSIIFAEILFRHPLTRRSDTDFRSGRQSELWATIIPAIKNELKGIALSCLFRRDKSTLALIMPFCDEEKGRNISLAIFELFNKRRFIPPHLVRFKDGIKAAIGLLTYPINTNEGCQDLPPEKLYDLIAAKGKEALAVAQSRFDYPLCFSREIEETLSLKIAANIHRVVDKLRRKWKKTRKFSLILARCDAQNGSEDYGPFLGKINFWLSSGQSILPCTEGSFFVYLPDISPEEALLTGQNLKSQIKEACGRTVAMGLASYPVLDYEKEEVTLNAYKALVHTDFFGPDTITAFDAVSLNISGDTLFNAGHIYGAIMEYKKGLSLDPQDVNLLNSLGVCYARLKCYKRAVSCFEKTLSLEKDNFMARYNLGLAYLKTGIPDKAFLALQQAASLNGNHFDILFQMGKLLQEQKRGAEAVGYFQKAAQCPNAKGYIYRYLGEAYLDLNLKKDAMAAFKRAVKGNPADAFSFSWLGMLYAELKNDLEIAHTLCQKALELDHQNSLYWKTIGRIYYLKNDYPQAIHHLKEAQRRMKKDHEIYYHLGLVYEKMGDLAEARRKWQKALKVNPLFKEARIALQPIGTIEE
ncbi:MAG TPA: tetratricopeptide repeat protein [Proteobacteria bacterium]|nr:tetratricopeptide repeat protein [Pseudomonadota bacterium]